MTILRDIRAIHWDYVLSLEEDLVRLSRFVDFSANDNTFSIEIARILMAAAAEADVVLKQICKAYDHGFSARSISAYFPVVTAVYPRFVNISVVIPRYGLTFHPWIGWTASRPPLWWTANNKVKHERDAHFKAANLKNCLNAVAGLFAAVLYLYRNDAQMGNLVPAPELLQIPNATSNAMGAHPARFYYRLP